jgi:tetratricopeptide (TPR) repeat protein
MTKKHFRRPAIEVLLCLALAILTFSIYIQILDFDFVNYDDDDYVYDNSQVKGGLTYHAILWALTTDSASNWHPLTWMSHMADVSLFGMNPGLHHLTNLVLHIINSLLLFLVFRNMTGKLWQSACVAALFAIHPLHVQSVAWVAERKDVLSAFFWMLTLWVYIRYVRRPGWAAYMGVLVFFILGLMSKPMVVTLPFVLLLLDFWPLGRIWPDVNMSLGRALDEQGDSEKALACLQKSVALDPKYYPGQYNLGTLLLKKGDWSQAIPHLEAAVQLDPDNDQAQFNLAKAFFDKKDYASALTHTLKAIALNPDHEKAHQIAGAIFLKHNQIDKALASFKKALIHDPDNKEAQQLVHQLEAKLAVAQQTVLLELEKNPDNPALRKQLGKIFQAQGFTDSAIEQYQRVIARHPESIDAIYELATLYADKGQYASAISYMEQAISLQPDNPAHDYNLACLYAMQENAPEALSWLKKALDKGYKNWDQIMTDEDLKSIRDSNEFKKLMENR